MYLLDTVAISALLKPGNAPKADRWFARVDLDDLHVPAPALAEIARGIARLPDGAKKRRLQEGYREQVAPLLEEACLPFDAAAALVWGELMGAGDATGRQLPIIDAQIAAIARVNDLIVVTRNVRDFGPMGMPTVNPWDKNGFPEPACR
jgi:predicted nucleic acid-binding protein